ncbi:MAG: 2-hydroxyacid dehydrogenase [Dehalococcoidia bacterium]
MALPPAVITLSLEAKAAERLARVASLDMCAGLPRAELLARLADAEGLLCSNALPVNAELFAAAPRLRVVSGFGVGYNNVDLEEANRRGIAICNTPGVLNDAVADLTIALILAASRRLIENSDYVRSGGWAGREPGPGLGFDIAGKTLGIVGYGRIGRAAAKRARAFGMRIIFYDLFTDPGPGDDARYRPLLDLMAESDIVSVHTNLTQETTHFLGQPEFARMKPTAWLVNTARGPVVDELALVEALKAGQLAGAALDVVEVEPPRPDAPILTAPNVILLPHVASATVETRAAMLELSLANFEAVIQGKTPPACVNPDALPRALKH